jgi:TatA/E family protein of Tat protein translocase
LATDSSAFVRQALQSDSRSFEILKGKDATVYALILETLSSMELLFILVIALIFFGPRRLPQLARSIGKGMSEFRKASEDFKRTWEREVAMETSRLQTEAHSILDMEGSDFESQNAAETNVEPADSTLVVARESSPTTVAQESSSASDTNEPVANSRKHDWL